ncbi:MAG: ATP synthase subunit I [Candidatus Hydrogenedentota bacterium]
MDNGDKQFRLLTVQLTTLATVVCAALALVFDRALAHGVLLGGIAGALSFWLMARRIGKVASEAPSKLQSTAFRWTLVRIALYGVVLYRAYTLDVDTGYGLIGAAGGLFLVKLAMILLGAAGLDLTKQAK